MRSSPKKIAMSLQARESASPRRVAANPEECSIEDGSWKEVDVCSPLKSDSKLKHRPLNAFRVVRGVLCLVVFLSTAFTILVCFAPVVAVLLRLFSIHYSRKATSFLFARWLALWPFLFEKINGTNVVFSGDTVPPRERILIIANHKTEVDWMYLWDLALRKGSLGYVKYVLKSSLMKLPVFGWGFHVLEFIPLKRKWEVDEPILRKMLLSFADPRDPLWLSIFPEGTDYDEEKCKKSQTFAAENGLPVLSHVLLPRTKGFCACLEALRGSLDAVYDLTIAYKNQCPSFMDNAFGVDPSEVHIHVRRISMEDIPESSTDAASWLVDTFHLKDNMLSDFHTRGHFPNEGGEEDISAFKGLVNFMLILILTVVIIYLTIFSSVWFKIYIGLSCAYLASATYFEIQPVPVLDFVKATLVCNRLRCE
ncbi:probable 1-acyl-sn-glycerol-3-phosphate acyltransferase 4 [Rosa rugosa]|uniref:probable 1-acyl-sn-glycerol-3-phosphate acyltransferase 4 n=1 Tax=Rosa rugosa TaxID=74645 RepID=UPI002B407D92|nr:probable 1-acyl-sn-glycerol-3-phosphate acyltransferase 4 [Rosa rugosa]